MEREQIEKMRAVVREFDGMDRCQTSEPLSYGMAGALRGNPGHPAPPVRGLCQEALEIQGHIGRLECQLASLRERMFGPAPTGKDCDNKRTQPYSMAEILTNSRCRLAQICEETELLLSQTE